MISKRLLCLATFTLFVGLTTPQSKVFAAIDDKGQFEVMHTEATIKFHEKKYAETQQILKKILDRDPTHVAALELQALTFRQLGKEKQAGDTYVQLLKNSASSSKEKRAGYHFDLAMIRYKEKKNAIAYQHFSLAANGGFNPGTSNFFMGVMDFNAKAWRSAKNHFSAALTESDAKPMTAVTRYYLASTYMQLGKTESAVQNFKAANETLDKETSNNPTTFAAHSSEIRTNALKELDNLNRHSKYLSLTYMNQFDSNVQTNPSEVSNPTAEKSQRSVKSVINAAGGYSTSPSKLFQAAGSYSFYTNYNYNQLARDFNFLSHSGKVATYFRPHSKFTAGVKAEAVYSMKNNLTAADSRGTINFRSFSLTGDIGPLFKYELTPRINLGLEAFWRPKRFYQDPTTGESIRSGHGLFSRFTADFISRLWFFNPTAYVSYEWDHPQGKTYRAVTTGLGISNSMQVIDKLTITPSVDVYFADYYDISSPKREDSNIALRTTASYSLTPHWTILGDLGYTVNDSTISTTYKYTRFVTSGGLTYMF